MDLLNLVSCYLESADKKYLNIMADYLTDNCESHPEFKVYFKRFMSGKVTTRTLLDVCVKFGCRRVRKEASKISRLCRKRFNSKALHLTIMRKGTVFNTYVYETVLTRRAKCSQTKSSSSLASE